MKIFTFFLLLLSLSPTGFSQDLLFGFRLTKIITTDEVLPIVKVDYQVMVQSSQGKMSRWKLAPENLITYQKLIKDSIGKTGDDRPVWKFHVNGRYGLLTYRAMSKSERKARKLKKGIYLTALKVTEDIFQDEDLKNQIREAEEATSLESLLTQNVDEITTTLEEMGGMETIVKKMCLQEHGQLLSSGDMGLFYPVIRTK